MAALRQSRLKQLDQREDRQRKGKRAALSQLALDPNGPTVAGDQLLADVESQAEPSAAGLDRVVLLVEPLEDQAGAFGADAAAGILDGDSKDAGIVLLDLGAQGDAPP